MKKFSYSLLGLAFVATAAQAQPAADPAGALPAPDAGVTAEAPLPDTALPPSDALPPEPVPSDAIPPAPSDDTATLPDTSADATVTADATAATAFTDAQIDSFAAATVEVQKIDSDGTLDDSAKQTQMAAAVNEAGLDAATYNEIGQAVATDLELRAKVQTAMAKHASPSDG